MRISKTAVLTLAALSSQNLTAEAKASPNINSYSQINTQETSNFTDSTNISSLPSTQLMSRPEILLSKPLNTPKIVAALSTPNIHQIREILNESWLGKIVEFTAKNSSQFPQVTSQISLQTDGENEVSLNLNPTITILNTLLLVATLFPPVTIGFFWLVRRLIIKELISEVNQRLKKIGELELNLNKSQTLVTELEGHIVAAKKSIEFIDQEAKISKSSVEQIETLKSQFLMQLQVITSEAQEAKYQAIQEINSSVNSEIKSIENTQKSKDSDKQITTVADDYLKPGEKLFSEGKYNQALAIFEKAISLNSDLSEAWFSRGNVFVKLQRHAEALTSYDKAISLDSNKFEYWFNRGNVLVRMQSYTEALASYDKALSFKPDNVTIWLNKGILLRKLQRYNEALIAYEQALLVQPKNVDVLHNLGAVLGKLQRYEEALSAFDKVLQIQPNKYEVWYNRGNFLGKLQSFAEAIDSYNRALEIQPEKYEIWYNKGALLWQLERYEQAVNSYDIAIKLMPDDYEVWHNRGVALNALERYEEAVSSFERAIEIKPQCYQAFLGKAEALLKLEKYEEALSCCNYALSIKKNSPEAWEKKGIVLEKLKSYKEALVCYENALAINPDDSECQRKRNVLMSELQGEKVLIGKNQLLSQGNSDLSSHQDRKLSNSKKVHPLAVLNGKKVKTDN